MVTDLEEMARMIGRFNDEIANLKRYLDELTTGDGRGYLRELKDIVGHNTDLGMAISNLGGAVMHAKGRCIERLDSISNIMSDKYNSYAESIAEALHQYQQINESIDMITFK